VNHVTVLVLPVSLPALTVVKDVKKMNSYITTPVITLAQLEPIITTTLHKTSLVTDFTDVLWSVVVMIGSSWARVITGVVI
jgi:hypothetical protein